MAMPYNVEHAERDADADVKIDVAWITDVKVATVYTEVTQYWTGEPVPETVAYTAPSTLSAEPVQTSSAPVQYTIEKTTTPEPTPTSSYVALPPPPPPPSSSAPAVPTTLITMSPAPASSSTTVQAPVSSDTSSGQKNSFGLDMGPSDYSDDPVFTPSGYTISSPANTSSDDFQAAVLQSTNAWRAKWGAGPLTWNDSLAAIAEKSIDSNCNLQAHSVSHDQEDLAETW